MHKPFKILSLSGGGIRGIYQATYLKNIFREAGISKSPYEYFDLICGTSTGAIVAMAVALDIPMDIIKDLYIEEGGKIFTKRNPLMSGFFSGSLYDEKNLRDALEKVFKSNSLNDLKTKVLVTASSIGQSSIETFNNFDGMLAREMSVVDAVMSSTAAPTYFPAHKVKGSDRSFIDGGLWANSPSSVGIVYAQKFLNVQVSDICLLSVGTSEYRQLSSIADYNKMRLYSSKTIKKVIDLFFCTQEHYDHTYSKYVLTKGNYIKINSRLPEPIALDKARVAIAKLPQLAEQEAKDSIDTVKPIFFTEDKSPKFHHHLKRRDLMPQKLVAQAGLSAFYTCRDDYEYRNASVFHQYILNAKKSLTMVGISLSKSEDFNEVKKVIRRKIEAENVTITISLLNPYRKYLLQSITEVLRWPVESLKNDIIIAAKNFIALKKQLPPDKRKYLVLRFHNSIPFASANIIDEDDLQHASIHLETKPYQVPKEKSFSFEVIPARIDGFFDTLKNGYNNLIRDGEAMQIKEKKLARLPA